MARPARAHNSLVMAAAADASTEVDECAMRLARAVDDDDFDAMEAALALLIQAGGSVNTLFQEAVVKPTLLHYASSAAAVHWLLDRGADLQAWRQLCFVGNHGSDIPNPAARAIVRRNTNAAIAMLSAPGADVNERTIGCEMTPLMYALWNRNAMVLRFLCDHPHTDFCALDCQGNNVFQAVRLSPYLPTDHEMRGLLDIVCAAAVARRRWSPLRAAWFGGAAAAAARAAALAPE